MNRVLTTAELTGAAREWRAEGAVIVLAAGCWDPLHAGHVGHLEAARAIGNVLVVAVASDRMVRDHKQLEDGPPRPFLPAEERAEIVAAMRCVDAASVNDDTLALLAAIRPHVYVKGVEYRDRPTPDLEEEAALLGRLGGRLEFASGTRVLSSSALLAGVRS